MKSITKLVMFLMMFTMPVLANDIYVTQSGATLTFDVLQDGQNNTIGNSTCLLYTSPSPRDKRQSRMPSSA